MKTYLVFYLSNDAWRYYISTKNKIRLKKHKMQELILYGVNHILYGVNTLKT